MVEITNWQHFCYLKYVCVCLYLWEKMHLLALNSVSLMESNVIFKQQTFSQTFLQEALPHSGIKWKDTFCLREMSSQFPHELLKQWVMSCSVILWLCTWALCFSLQLVVSHHFTSPSVNSLWTVTEQGLTLFLTSCQSSKTSRNGNQDIFV